MPYATAQDLIDRFGEQELIDLTDKGITPQGVINALVLDGAIADADAEIEGYLIGRYALPLATVPGVLTRIACDIARYHLYDDLATEQVRDRYEDARRLLESIASGKVQLGLPGSTGATPVAGSPEVDTGTPDRVFSKDTLEGF